MEHRNGPAPGAVDGVEDAEDGHTWADDGTAHEDASPKVSLRSVPTWIAVVLLVLALGAGYLLGRPSHPLDTSPDAGFLRDMSAHHAQAVDMSMIILDKTEDSELDTVATDIARTQQAQIGIMQGWLMAWDLNSRGTRSSMAWMEGHDHGGGGEVPDTMPGLASSEEMVALEEAEGVEAEILFLELMIAHHEGGIDMAQAEVDLGEKDLVVDLAQGMIEAQQTEIDLMENMIDKREGGAED
ncbi:MULTISPECIES: DUF305 domain-containing protein [Nocardiopsis]|uniref:DUF305 domain-containing protein n=1 Tax=Nocardiopsis sinuspersici TaxID=501010 RepID=A0A1V3BV98_9ACTN|nr:MULTISPECIES: DUF305 domain-containing protein [Nocardiopsis]OOC52574.1 DUF305 domain-containing protein [Nocardiopsis sinuspersici]